MYILYIITLEDSRDNFLAKVVNHTKSRQNMPYIYILTHGGRFELSQLVSRLFGFRKTRRIRALLLSSVPRVPYSAFSRSINTNARQNETVPHLVYTPTSAPSLPQIFQTTVTYQVPGYLGLGRYRVWRAENHVEDQD